jgi:hypothetical protein
MVNRLLSPEALPRFLQSSNLMGLRIPDSILFDLQWRAPVPKELFPEAIILSVMVDLRDSALGTPGRLLETASFPT